MRLTRTQFLGLSAAAAGTVSLSGCAALVQRYATPEVPDRVGEADADPVVWRVLNRAMFGPRPGDVERVAGVGVDAFIEEQLAPERIPEDWASSLRVGTLDTLEMDAEDARDWEMSNFPEVGKGQAAVELQQACLIRAVYSARQLQEVMMDFWSDHFNVSQLKADCSWLKTVDDRLLRKHAMGKFRDLVSASAHSPAMLFYLDNDKNRRRDAGGDGPNENYARELLELHTLGVNGGYSLKDVQEIARCFSGWGFKKGLTWKPGDFEFRAGQHDDGSKHVLGTLIPGGQGVRDGEQVIDLVCHHPSTARYLARKLCRRFVADRPDPKLVARVAGVFERTDGDIRQVLSALLHSEEFKHGGAPKLKRPVEYAVSAMRAVNANSSCAGVLPHLERMGQLPYKWTMPDGYPERPEAWAPGLLARWNFVVELVQGRLAGTSVPLDRLARATRAAEPLPVLQGLSRAVLGKAITETGIRSLVGEHMPKAFPKTEELQAWTALLLASPGFQYR